MGNINDIILEKIDGLKVDEQMKKFLREIIEIELRNWEKKVMEPAIRKITFRKEYMDAIERYAGQEKETGKKQAVKSESEMGS